MQLQLRHNHTGNGKVSSAFLRGSDPLLWMLEISQWSLESEDLEAYIIRNNSDGSNAGLFVIFKKPDSPSQIELLEPYITIAEKLYIPLHTELYPRLTVTELKSVLIWDKQVFHPVFGFTGLNKSDQVNAETMFAFLQPQDRDWSFAHPGVPARVEFQSIHIQQPGIEKMMEEIKKEIGDKKLEDIKGEDKKLSAAGKVWNDVKYFMIKEFYYLITSTDNKTSTSPGTHKDRLPGGSGGSDFNGVFGKFINWIEQNLEALESKREKEINKLLKMFDENTDEALKYAIPMNSPYLQRGKEQSSAVLGRRSTDFNLGNLRGGGARDAWNISDDHNLRLHKKYEAAAQDAISKTDYRKAAYVYAYLLGNYFNAAQALKQGGHYREAAVLYLEHLNNKAEAAECYQQGGLYLEAIELYLEMNKEEEAGDLYLKLELPEKAMTAYRVSVDRKKGNIDMIEAARILNEKMDNPSEAKEVLLEGWHKSYNSESCLKKYYDITVSKQPELLIDELKNVYQHDLPPQNVSTFLDVLDYVNKKRFDPELQEAALEIAYEIIHSKLEIRETKLLKKLGQFLPEDKLILADASRYATKLKTPTKLKPAQDIMLGADTRWLTAVNKHHFFIATGIKGRTHCIIRGNWQGNLEYYVLSDNADPGKELELVNEPFTDSPVFINSLYNFNTEEKYLPKNGHFNHMARVRTLPAHIAEDPVCIYKDKIVSLTLFGGMYKLVYYDFHGKENNNHYLVKPFEEAINEGNCGLIRQRLGYFFFSGFNQIYMSDITGNCTSVSLDCPIHYFELSEVHPSGVWIVVSTEKGCMLGRLEDESISMTDQIFAREFKLRSIVFLNHCHFALLAEKEVRIYKVQDSEAIQVKLVSAQTRIIAVLPTATLNECAVFEESGEISIHQHGKQ